MSDEPVDISNQEGGQGEQTPSSKKPGFAPASADLEIFKLLYEYRFLRREHFSLLTGRNPTSLHYRLKKLAENGYLNDLKIAKQPGQKHIYSLGKAALRSLVEKGIADEEVLIKRLRTHELKPLYLNHEMMIIDFHVMLSLATRGSFLRLVRWEEGRHLYGSVVVKGEKLLVTPDAFFTLEDSRRPAGRNQADFFLEADRTTETWPKQFQNKVRAYWCYLKDGPHEKQFSEEKITITNFRVLTLTISHKRAEILSDKTHKLVPEGRKHYLFSSLENFSLENPAPILEAVYLRPGAQIRHPLIPPPQPSQVESSVV